MTSHPEVTDLLKQGPISVASSFIPGYCSDVNKMMEEIFMHHVKSHGSSGSGIAGIITNQEAYKDGSEGHIPDVNSSTPC